MGKITASEKPWTIQNIVKEAPPPKEKEHKEWNDQLEAVQFTTRVFSKLSEVITEDFVLATLTEEQKEFVKEQIKQAILVRRLLPDKEVGETIFTTLVAESIMVAVLNRNVPRNVLLKIIGKVREEDLQDEIMHDDTGKTVGGKLLSTGRKLLPGGG